MGLSRLRTSGGAAVANALRRALGLLWLADAVVKILIPFGDRATDQWYEQIMTAETGPPGLHYFLAWQTNLFAAHPFLWWLPAAELGIGAWLVARPGSRRALAVSAAWALVVWVAGEGMGGLFGGVSSVLTGYPGAALLYALAAAVLFPRREPREAAAAAAEAGVLGLYWSRVVWLALWMGAALFTALPQVGEGGLVFMLSTSQVEAPGPLRSLDSSELRWLTLEHSNILGIAVAVACVAVGFGVFLGVLTRLFLSLAALTALGRVGGHGESERHLHRLNHGRGNRPGADRAGPGVLARRGPRPPLAGPPAARRRGDGRALSPSTRRSRPRGVTRSADPLQGQLVAADPVHPQPGHHARPRPGQLQHADGDQHRPADAVTSRACRRANPNALIPRWNASATNRNGIPMPRP